MDVVVDFECLQGTSNIIILNDLVLRDGFVILMCMILSWLLYLMTCLS